MLTHKGTETLHTPRLILRRFTTEDAPDMYRNWASSPEVTRFLTWPTHGSVEVTRTLLTDWVKQYSSSAYYHWAIVLGATGQVIGSLCAAHVEDSLAACELGYCIGKPWWHQGLMTEAVTAVMDFLFDQVGMNRIAARHDPNNPHSGDVMRKCGMHYEGTARQADRNNQGICDCAYYARLRSDR